MRYTPVSLWSQIASVGKLRLRRGVRRRVAKFVGVCIVFGATGLSAPRLIGAAPAATSGARASSQAVYAAFTVNLTRFITWPEDALGPAGTPFVIGTFLRDPINAELDDAVRGEIVAGHPVRTVRLRSLNDVRDCQLIFISRGVADPAAVLARVQHRPILTVSDTDGFLALGGHVRFVPQQAHIRLEISAENLRACALEARAQLLRIAATP